MANNNVLQKPVLSNLAYTIIIKLGKVGNNIIIGKHNNDLNKRIQRL